MVTRSLHFIKTSNTCLEIIEGVLSSVIKAVQSSTIVSSTLAMDAWFECHFVWWDWEKRKKGGKVSISRCTPKRHTFNTVHFPNALERIFVKMGVSSISLVFLCQSVDCALLLFGPTSVEGLCLTSTKYKLVTAYQVCTSSIHCFKRKFVKNIVWVFLSSIREGHRRLKR